MDRAQDVPERRASVRNGRQNSATSLIQTLLQNPGEAATRLEGDLDSGAAPGLVLALLDAAESLATTRGLNLSSAVGSVRTRITRRIESRSGKS